MTVYAIVSPIVQSVAAPAAANAFGTNLLFNGSFAADVDWLKGVDWTIAAGVAAKAAGATTNSLEQAVAFVPGGVYEVTFTIVTYTGTGGTFFPRFAGGTVVSGTGRNTVGTFTEQLTAGAGNNLFRLVGGPTAAGTIDNISLVRVA